MEKDFDHYKTAGARMIPSLILFILYWLFTYIWILTQWAYDKILTLKNPYYIKPIG